MDLQEILGSLDGYNQDIFDASKETRNAIYDAANRIYKEHKQEIDELNKKREEVILQELSDIKTIDASNDDMDGQGLLESLRNFIPVQQAVRELSPEEKREQELLKLFSDAFKEIGITYYGGTLISIRNDFIDARPEDIRLELMSVNNELTSYEKIGYGLLFQAAFKILDTLVPSRDYNATYWGGECDYISRFTGDGNWKHLGLEGQCENPFHVKHIVHDISSPEKPFEDESEDVAIIKTLGSVVSPEERDKFWKKATASLKIGGIVISSYVLPDDMKERYEQVTDLAGTKRDCLEFNYATQRIDYYHPDKLYFFRKVR